MEWDAAPGNVEGWGRRRRGEEKETR